MSSLRSLCRLLRRRASFCAACFEAATSAAACIEKHHHRGLLRQSVTWHAFFFAYAHNAGSSPASSLVALPRKRR